VRGSEMGAASAATSSLGLDLDLTKHRVLMRMRNGARRRAATLAHGRPELVMGWMHAQGKQLQDCGSYGGGGDSDGRKKRMSVVNLDPSHSIYRGVHPIRPLKLLPPYGAHRNGSISII
jgi:hypothetical protein